MLRFVRLPLAICTGLLLTIGTPSFCSETTSGSNWPSNILAKEMPAPVVLQPTQAVSGAVEGTVSCGSDASFYYRLNSPRNVLEEPITRLNKDGSEIRFDLRKLPGATGAVYVMAFALGPERRIYSILSTETDGSQYLASYESDGSLRWTAPLPFSIWPSTLLPISEKEFLIAGMTTTRKNTVPFPVIALVDSSGKIIRSLTEQSDEAATVRSASGSYFNHQVAMSAGQTDSNGSIYLFKAAAYPKVQVLDAQGNTSKVLQLIPPAENAEATQFFLDGGRIVVLYQQQLPSENGKAKGRLLVATYNTADGKPTGLYIQHAPGILACISEGQATILATTIDRHFAVGRVPMN